MARTPVSEQAWLWVNAWGAAVLAIVAVVVLGAAGCGRGITSTPGEAPNLEEWVANVRARPAPPLEPLPVMQQFETFEYAAQGLRDPFSDAFPDTGGFGPRPDSDRRKHELEDFPLDSLEMVGTIGRGAGIIGLVMAPSKVTHRVRIGDYAGQADGRITSITEDRIELVELVPDGAGGRREHCALPHLLAEGTPLTGLWQEHIGGGSSWRLGLHQRGNRIEAVVYGFDDAGEARWLAGSTRWRGSGAVSIALWRQRGCDDCERPWQEQSPAGTLTVRPAAAGQTGTLQADIHAVLAAGTVLHRQNVTLVPSVP